MNTTRSWQRVWRRGFCFLPLIGLTLTGCFAPKATLRSTEKLEDNPKQLQVSAEVQPGSSGAPLLNERREVIGMVAATLNPLNVLARTGGNLPQNVNFAIKAGPIPSKESKASLLPSHSNSIINQA